MAAVSGFADPTIHEQHGLLHLLRLIGVLDQHLQGGAAQ